MRKKYCVSLDLHLVERYREAARVKSVQLRRDVKWQDLIRDAAARYLEGAPQPAPDAVATGGA